MTSSKSHVVPTFLRSILPVVALILLAVSCSGGQSTPSGTAAPTAESQPEGSETPASPAESASETSADPTAVAVADGPTLDDADLASVDDVAAGEQIRDVQGNLLAIYGYTDWSQPFQDLSDSAQADFPFFGDVEALTDPSLRLVALDVGMCSAGIDATGFGTAEFFVHDSPSHVLSQDPIRDRGVLARHPVMHPSFGFPRSAECTRGWLPVLWAGDGQPGVARYVLTTRTAVDADIERHVYQWELPELEQGDQASDELFGLGQTVTFNDGTIEGTTVVVDGWAEFIGAETAVEGTRVVGVSLTYCPATARLPEFGLAVDGWNLISPAAGSELLGGRLAADVTASCFDGWLEFEVPFGGVPTGFFASDGVNVTTGYAEWSLADGALPAPS